MEGEESRAKHREEKEGKEGRTIKPWVITTQVPPRLVQIPQNPPSSPGCSHIKKKKEVI